MGDLLLVLEAGLVVVLLRPALRCEEDMEDPGGAIVWIVAHQLRRDAHASAGPGTSVFELLLHPPVH